jgi:hypothetical protein
MPGAEDQNQPGADEQEEKKKNNKDESTGNPDDESSNQDDGELDYADAEKVKAEIKKLRAENAKSRVKNKELAQKANLLETTFGNLKKSLGLEGEDASPEEKIKALQKHNEALQTEIAISGIERENGIPSEHSKYFRFLLSEKMSALEEGAEIDEADLQEIVAEVKGLATKKGKSSTGVNSPNHRPDEGAGALTVEKFASMNMGERSQLYAKNRAEYDRLFKAASEKRLL